MTLSNVSSPQSSHQSQSYDGTVNQMINFVRKKYGNTGTLGLSTLTDKEVHHLIDEKVMEKLSSGEFKLNDNKKDYGNMALPTDTSARASYHKDETNEPRTSQLWSNLIIRNLILTPMNLIGAYKNDDLMTRGDIFVSTLLWPIEDIPKIVKRYKDKAKNIYKEPIEKPQSSEKFKDKLGNIWKKHGLTEGALRTTLPFLVFDGMAFFLPPSKD